MGKKRRIMTSGQKFVKKYRSFLEKAGDAADGGDTILMFQAEHLTSVLWK